MLNGKSDKKQFVCPVAFLVIFTALRLTVHANEKTFLSEGFEGADVPSGWLNIDGDGDTYNWNCDETMTPHGGSECAASASYSSDRRALAPDNWLITRAVDLIGYSSIELSYWVAAQDHEYVNDHLEVWVSTTGNDLTDFTDQVDDYTETDDVWKQRTVDLSAYTEQTVHLAFRHCECTDMYRIKIDDVGLEGTGATVPHLAYSPVSHNFGLLEQGQMYETSFEIWNSGIGSLDWRLSAAESWLAYHPAHGSSTGEHDVITVTIDATELSSGSYRSDIQINSNGGDDAFSVRFQDDWPGFRGPSAMGVSDAKGLPVQWDTDTNLPWKTPLPGAGTSSPITFGDHIYLTCYSGYAVPHVSGGSLDQLKLHLIALRRDTGKILWDRTIPAKQPEKKTVRDHGYAANTPAADTDRIYAFFGKTGVFAFDHQGNQLWQADVGSNTSGWGTGASPLLYQDTVIINASVESRSLLALDRTTGAEIWRAPGIREAWNTPLIVTADSGRQELVVAQNGDVLAFDPDTGASFWSCATDISWYMVPTAVAAHGIIYYLGGRSGTAALAVRAGGHGDVTTTHRLWTSRNGSNVTSPIYWDGHLYWMNEKSGRAYCARAANGELVYEEKLDRAGAVYASPVLAEGRLYYLNRAGKTFVLAATPEFEQLSVNELEDGSRFDASPAVVGNCLLLRSGKFLYCLAEQNTDIDPRQNRDQRRSNR